MDYCVVETLELTANRSIHRDELELKLKAVKGTHNHKKIIPFIKFFSQKYEVIYQDFGSIIFHFELTGKKIMHLGN